jgi:hypothetical protein
MPKFFLPLQEEGRGMKELKNFHAVIKPLLGVCNK